MCCQSCFSQNVLLIIFFSTDRPVKHDFFPECADMIGSIFWKKYIIGSKFYGKTWLGAHSGKKHGWQDNVLLIIFFSTDRPVKHDFFPECAVNYVFFLECAANHVFPQNLLRIIYFSQNVLPIKHDWQHILGKNMISSTFWGKKHD
jgi:hypothetical protein